VQSSSSSLNRLRPDAIWASRSSTRLILPARELTLLNVNFPENDPAALRWTRQSVRHYDGKVVPGEDPMGPKHFWFVVTPIEEAEEGTDRWAVEQGYVSLTPLRLDLTNESELASALARYPLG
jgi:5'-nucleotidase